MIPLTRAGKKSPYNARQQQFAGQETGAYAPFDFPEEALTRLEVGVIAVAVLALVGCQQRESITGGYGDHVVAGQVAMAAGMLNSSPAGVRVTVGATGMSAVLDAAGNFMFVNVPDNADLHFTRGADGIDAHFDTSAAIGPVFVELSTHSASSGRRRTAPPTAVLKQIEGVVTAISATDVTVNGTKFTFTKDTVIRHGDTPIAPADIKIGDRVHVKANGTAAVEILVQNTGDQNEDQTMTANGTVTATSASGLTVATEAHGSVTVNVDSSTIIRKQDAIIRLADIKIGDQVNTMGTRVDAQTEKAKQIEVRGVSGHN